LAASERARAIGDGLLERYGIVTRGSVVAERLPGGFAAAYRVLKAFEDVGRCQRVYAIEGLGAAQFTLPTAVDRMRSGVGPGQFVALGATDPANAYGAALPWPSLSGLDLTHRPGRKAGGTVALADGSLVLYLEKGGRSLLVWPTDDSTLLGCLRALHRAGGTAVIDRANGRPIHESAGLVSALIATGFVATPKGYRVPRNG
jgi:ATP-dependent Lhr-like helicase